MTTTTPTRKQQIAQIQKRSKLLLETLLGIDRALDNAPRRTNLRASLLRTRLSIGETNQQLHQMDDDELAEWGQSVENMIEKIKTWLDQASNRATIPPQESAVS